MKTCILSIVVVVKVALPACAIPKPAAVFCVECGYQYETRTDPNGNQYGVCIFPHGSECEAWAYYRKCNLPQNSEGDCHWPCPNRIIYVDDDSNGLNDGSSWQNAYNFLQDALADANDSPKPVEIRVAKGIYKPDQGKSQTPGDREATFQLINGVTLTGAYAGFGEPDANAPDIEEYETVLSGDLAGDDLDIADPADMWDEPSRAENSYHVVTGNGTDATAILDGFIIAFGNANACFPDPNSRGGGMYNNQGSPTLDKCTFRENSAKDEGGGMYNRLSSTTLTNCMFVSNSADHGAGGIQTILSDMTLIECTFGANRAREGGAMYNHGEPSPMISKCTFDKNSANFGGVVQNRYSSAIFTHCVFTENSANEGGVIREITSNSKLTNCTFIANSASEGSCLACDSYEHSNPSNIQFANCILWDGGDEIWNEDGSIITVTYSNVQLGHRFPWPGQGNIDADPSFKDPGNGDYHLKSQAGRWDANEGRWTIDEVTSPCIDAGDAMSPIGFEPFPNGGRINMGAYGGTAEASKSYFGEPLCETIVAGDINGDCKVDAADLSIMTYHWLCEQQ